LIRRQRRHSERVKSASVEERASVIGRCAPIEWSAAVGKCAPFSDVIRFGHSPSSA
jgi:hypothetical protein